MKREGRVFSRLSLSLYFHRPFHIFELPRSHLFLCIFLDSIQETDPRNCLCSCLQSPRQAFRKLSPTVLNT